MLGVEIMDESTKSSNTLNDDEIIYQNEKRKVIESNNDSRKKLVALFICFVGIAIILGILLFLYSTNPQRNIDSAAKAQYKAALVLFENGEYDSAKNELKNVDPLWSKYKKVNEQLIIIVKKQLEEEIDYYEATENYTAIIFLIRNNIENINEDADIESAYIDAVKKYRELILKNANALLSAGKLSNAESILETALETLPGDKALGDKLSEIQQKIILKNLKSYKDKKDYESAIKYYNKNTELGKSDTDIQTILVEIKNLYRNQILYQAKKYYEKKDYTKAVAKLDNGLLLLPNDKRISDKRFDYKKKEILVKLNKYESNNDFRNAVKYLKKNSSIVKKDSELQLKNSEFKKLYRSDVIKKAKTEYKKNGYNAAITKINKALEVLPNDSKLLSEIEEYKKCEPVDLLSLNYYDCYNNDNFEILDSATDTQGKKHYNILCGPYCYTASRTYEINKKYDRLTATGFVLYGDKGKGKNNESVIRIYGDNKQLYCKNIKGNMKSYTISVNISGVTDLKIEMTGLKNLCDSNVVYPLMSNIKLQKVRK